jgi:hypothetical protein
MIDLPDGTFASGNRANFCPPRFPPS